MFQFVAYEELKKLYFTHYNLPVDTRLVGYEILLSVTYYLIKLLQTAAEIPFISYTAISLQSFVFNLSRGLWSILLLLL